MVLILAASTKTVQFFKNMLTFKGIIKMKNLNIVGNPKLFVAALFFLFGCASAFSLEVAAPERQDAFTFVVMGDNHPSSDPKDKYTQPPEFYRAIDEINLLDPDFVVLTGDLIQSHTNVETALTKMWDEFDTAVAGFRMPYYQVIGNHDVSNAGQQRIYLERYGDRFPLFYSFGHNGCRFIVLDSELHGEYKNITDRQLVWLKKELKRHRDARKLFVFLHQPLWKYGDSNWMKEVHPLLAQYRVDTVFCGHLHMYTKHATLDGVRYVVTGGAGAKLNDSEFEGGFYHYCVVTVRGNKVSIAVVRTGHIENEEVVNEDLFRKVDTFTALLRPISLRVDRAANKLPEQMDFVVPNPFDEELSGTLAWELPQGSPWRMLATEVAISVKPGKEQRLTIHVPPGGSVTDIKPLEPFPIGIWNLSVGDRSLWRNREAKVIVDRWPYADVRATLNKTASMDSVKRIVAAPEVATTLRISRNNPTELQVQKTISWRLPEGCRWKVSPTSEVIDLAPGDERELKFDVTFSGSPDKIFPLPRMETLIKLDGEEVLRISARLPVKTKDYLSKEIPVARCLRVKTGPNLDGNLDDTLWQKCYAVSNFLRWPNADSLTDYPAQARFAYDSKNLYISLRCFEPNLSGLVTKTKEHDGAVYTDDSVEIFLDTNFDRQTYYQYIFNANGVIFDAIGRDESWNGSCTVKAGRESNAWTLEAAISWKVVGMETPKAGTRIGLELVHNRVQEPRETAQWSPTFSGSHHTPSRFGVLILE